MPSAIRLLLIDSLNLIRRVYAAQASATDSAADEGLDSSVRSLRRALAETRPTHVVAVFDGEGRTWRHELFADYKAGRKPMPEELREALPRYHQAFSEQGVVSLERPGLEADDVIATLARKVASAGGQPVVLSTDRGFLQLLEPLITVRDHFRQLDLGAWQVRESFQVEPQQLLDFLALSGDTTGSVSGVPGVGPKTAAKLLEDWSSLEGVLEAASEVEARAKASGDRLDTSQSGPSLAPKLAKKLTTHREAALLARRLVELRSDLDVGVNLKDLRYSPRA